jgi:hypothetical protein
MIDTNMQTIQTNGYSLYGCWAFCHQIGIRIIKLFFDMIQIILPVKRLNAAFDSNSTKNSVSWPDHRPNCGVCGEDFSRTIATAAPQSLASPPPLGSPNKFPHILLACGVVLRAEFNSHWASSLSSCFS